MPFSSPIIYQNSDTSDNYFSSDKITAEINSSDISAALSRIDTEDQSIMIYFASDISDADKNTLDTIIANHTGRTFTFAKNFKEMEYNAIGKLIRETYFADKTADGTFLYKVEETLYTYSANGLSSEVSTLYSTSGQVLSTKTFSYKSNKSNGSNTVISFSGV